MNSVLAELKGKYKNLIRGELASLKQEGFKARADAAAVKIELPMSWRSKDRNIEFNLHAWRFLEPFWKHYFDTQDVDCLNEIGDYISDWERFLLEGGRSNLLWYDMATGLRASMLALYYDVLAFYPDNKNIELVERLARLHIEKLSDQNFITEGNHALHQINGLRLLCIALKVDGLDSYCADNVSKLIDSIFDKNYVGTENSPFYHKYNLAIVAGIPADLYPSLKDRMSEIVSNGRQITPWLTDLNGQFYCIGDSEGAGDKLYNKICTERYSLDGQDFCYKDLHESGYCIVRSLPSTPLSESFSLIFHATTKSKIHMHADQLSFLLSHRGVELFADSGKFTYEYNKWKDYFVSDAAHNTVGLVDAPVIPKIIQLDSASMDPIQFIDEELFLCAQKSQIELFEHARSIRVKPSKRIVLSDSFRNITSSEVELRFHFSEHINASIDSGVCKLFHDTELYAQIEIDPKCISAEIVRGQTEPKVQGWISRKYNEKKAADVLIVSLNPLSAESKLLLFCFNCFWTESCVILQ